MWIRAPPPPIPQADLKQLKLNVDTFGTKFDVILVDPPWEEYVRRAPGMVRDTEVWTWQEIRELEIEAIADNPSFIFLWCVCVCVGGSECVCGGGSEVWAFPVVAGSM